MLSLAPTSVVDKWRRLGRSFGSVSSWKRHDPSGGGVRLDLVAMSCRYLLTYLNYLRY